MEIQPHSDPKTQQGEHQDDYYEGISIDQRTQDQEMEDYYNLSLDYPGENQINNQCDQ